MGSLTDQPDSSLPMVFGRYLLLRRLSRGGMGEVFLAKSGQLTGFEKICVVKKILPHLAEDREFIRRFIDEAQVTIRLSHANIASVFEVGMAGGEYFLALEYVEGRDLRRLLSRLYERRERLPLELALWIVRDVAAGLGYAHRRTDPEGTPLNLVHCDVSPPNVMVSFEGEVKLIDFGIAKSAMRVSATNPRFGFGKFGYMAPEQLVRGGVVDRRTDIYAAGVLLYELLVGERLFQFAEGADYKQIARDVTQGRHALPSQRDPSLYDFDPIVVKALAPDPARRYQHAEELRDDVQLALVRINPTLTADRLGGYVRSLFADEIVEDRNLLAQASAVDLTPWAEELTGARTHTVSFALSDVAAPVAASSEHSGTMLVERATPASGGSRRRRFGLIAGVAAGSLTAGAALAFALLDRAEPSAAKAAAAGGPPPQPIIVQPLAAADPVAGPAPPAPAEPAAPPQPTAVPPPDAARPSSKAPPAAKKPPAARAPKAPEPTPASGPNPQAVEAKFRAVKSEYDGFKRRFGPRLDAEWNDILNLATYEKGEERYKKLDVKLDRFRRRMEEIRRDQGG